jgi:thiamine kinase-like enzyme
VTTAGNGHGQRADTARAGDALLSGLRDALREAGSDSAEAPLQLMSDKGLAHHHVRLVGTGLIARLPKQSQMGLRAQDNIDYEAACFHRAAVSGHAPRVMGVLAAQGALPRGGLLVEEVNGRPARLPADLEAIAQALAAIHSLPLPEVHLRPPLLDAHDPLDALRLEIEMQAVHLEQAQLEPAARALIDGVRDAFQRRCEQAQRPARRLIAFDAHPGNFLVRDDGLAVLVDLEKARYSHPPLDLAHATLYTSTTWDVATHAELTPSQVANTYRAWEAAADLGSSQRPWFIPLRAAMWLWSVTWCAKWRALSPREAQAGADGEDWSQQHTDQGLVRHVRERVDCYLSTPVIERIVDELGALEKQFSE